MGAVVSFLVFAALVWRERRKGQMGRKATPLDKVRDGALATVAGKVVEIAGEPLSSLGAQRECAWFSTELSVGKSAMSWDPEVLFDEGDGRDFWIEDDSGRALVQLSRVVLHTPPRETFPRPDGDEWEHVQELCAERGLKPLVSGARYCLSERVLAVGDRVTVAGKARRELDNDGASRLVVRTPRGSDAILSDSLELLGEGARVERAVAAAADEGEGEGEGEGESSQTSMSFMDRLLKLTPRVWATPLLVVANLVVFAVMVIKGVSPFHPDPDVLAEWGANYGPLTKGEGEWWRLLTATYVHASLVHVAMNVIVLIYAGRVVERLVGWFGFLVMYTMSGLLGSVISLAANPGATSVGASGAVLGIFGCLLGVLVLQRKAMPVRALTHIFIAAVAFIGLTVAAGFAFEEIDLAAHLGGLFGGFLCGFALALPLEEHMLGRRTARGFLAVTVGTIAVLAAAIPFSHHGKVAQLEYEIVDFGGFSMSLPKGKAERQGDDKGGRYVVQIAAKPRGRVDVQWQATPMLKTKRDLELMVKAMPDIASHEMLDTDEPRANGRIVDKQGNKGGLGVVLCPDAGVVITIVSAVKLNDEKLAEFQNELTRGLRCAAVDKAIEPDRSPVPGFQPPPGFGHVELNGQHMFVSPEGSLFALAPLWHGQFKGSIDPADGPEEIMKRMLGGLDGMAAEPLERERADGSKLKIWSGTRSTPQGEATFRLALLQCKPGMLFAVYSTPAPETAEVGETALLTVTCPDPNAAKPPAFPSFESVFTEACEHGNNAACAALYEARAKQGKPPAPTP